MYRILSIQLDDGIAVTVSGPADTPIHVGDPCVIEFNRIPEFGRVARLEEREGEWASHPIGGILVRRANLHDQARAQENVVVSRMALKAALRRTDELKLPIHLVSVRYSFDRSVLHLVYTAEDRVECGELIKGLAAELRTRVELRQIGVRDAARLAGGMGPCGRGLCCRTWLRDFDGVSVKMAKAQRVALNPATIGGMCGRLKCCLRYEFDLYRSCGEKLPKDGARVQCAEGRGVVIDKDVLARRVKVRFEDGRVLDMDASEVKPQAEPERHPPAGGGKPRHENTRA